MKKEIQEIFQIKNRGAVVVLGEVTDRIPGKSYRVQVILTHGRCLKADAFKEWILRTNPMPVEKEAYILKGLKKTLQCQHFSSLSERFRSIQYYVDGR
jgi:hypothetical protein